MKKRRALLLLMVMLLSIMSNIPGNMTLSFAASSIPHYEQSYRSNGTLCPYEYYVADKGKNQAEYNSILASGQLPLYNGVPAPPINLKGQPFNYKLWYGKGLVVYGTFKSISPNRFKCGYQKDQVENPEIAAGDGFYEISLSTNSCSVHGKSCPTKSSKNTVRGEWQYFGQDYQGNRATNMWFINDINIAFNSKNWITEPWKDEWKPQTNLNDGPSIINRQANNEEHGKGQ